MSQNQVQIIEKPLPPKKQQHQLNDGLLQFHKVRILNEIKACGADTYDLLLPETRALPMVINPDEHITGIVYGRYTWIGIPEVGRAALVSTDSRVLLLDKKFLFLHCDEIGYGAVSAITYARVGYIGTIVLHTRLGDIKLRTLNGKCAKSFVESIEKSISDRSRETRIRDRYGIGDKSNG